MFYVIAEPCVDVKDGSCAKVCPAHCIHTTAEAPMYYIDAKNCIGCRVCELACPVSAIFSAYDLPEKWDRYKKVNAAFFGR